MEFLETEATMANTIYLACNRGSVSEQLASIPAKELPDYEYLKNYHSKLPPDEDFAWGDAFSGTAAWLADRERRRREKEKNAPDSENPRPTSWQDGASLGGHFSRV